MLDLSHPGSLQTTVLILGAAVIPVAVFGVGFFFLRGAQMAQRKPIIILVASILFFIGYILLCVSALKSEANPIKGVVYLVLGVGWLIIGAMQYLSRRQTPSEKT
jgi:predicted tellurium resistance membrane protein TerC